MPSSSSTTSSAIPLSFHGSNGVTEYAIGTQLGTGSSGTVFTCTDLSDDSLYAVKVVKLQHMQMSMSGEEYAAERAKLHREVNILRELSHPNVIRLVDVAETETAIFVVQELIEGGELFVRITDDENFKNENVVKFVFCQLADAVLYLHSKSVIHRDIKAENVLIQSCEKYPPPGVSPIPDCPVYPVIKIVDFGLSKQVSSLKNLAQTWVGTPQYWAPEVIQSREKGTNYDGRSDVWSVGVLLYVMLCRRYPFTEAKVGGAGVMSMQEKIIKGDFSFPAYAKLDPNAKDLVKKLIVPDVNARITLEQSLVHPWLAGFAIAEQLAQRWPVKAGPLVSVVTSNSEGSRAGETAGLLVSEPTVTSVSSSVVEDNRDQKSMHTEMVQYMFPPPVDTLVSSDKGASDSTLPVVPNLALTVLDSPTSSDIFQLTELAKIQSEIIYSFFKIQESFRQHPSAYHLMASFATRARELQFLSATTVSRFAVTAELTESVVDDSAAFVEAGAIEASLSCTEEIRDSVTEMMVQCRVVQEDYRKLMDDVNNLIGGSRIALVAFGTSNQMAAIGDAPMSLVEEPMSISSGGTTNKSLDFERRVISENRRISTSSSSEADMSSVIAEAISVEMGEMASAAIESPNRKIEQLLNSSLRDLRKVDDILGRCRLFWSNVEQCLVRLDHFKTSSARLIGNVHLSPTLMQRYKARVDEHRKFWTSFRITCTEYAKVSQLEYQKFIHFANAQSPNDRD